MPKFVFIIILVLLFSSVYAQDNERMDDLTFKIAVYGPNDEIFAWWGHAALIINDANWYFERVIDWGINSHPNESFVKDFIDGLIQYSVTSSTHRVNTYINEDRDVTIYTLNLDRHSKVIMLSYIENIILPENRYYDYHEFLDNCATGVRDIIDLGTGGQFKAAFDSFPGRFSYRQHVLRYTWFRPLSDWILSFLMGQNLDEQITPWDEMFLPVEIARNIVDFSYIDSSGVERELVSSVQLINSSKNRLPVLNKPLVTWPFFMIAGFIIMILLFLADGIQKKYPRLHKILMGISHSIFGLLFGLLGCILFFGLLMDNDYFQQNINIVFINPLLLIIVPLGFLYAANKSILMDSGKLLQIIWSCVFIVSLVTLFLRMLPFFFQQNQSVYALILPVAFALGNVPQLLFICIKKCKGYRALVKK